MSTHTSSKPSLESLQKKLESLHKRRYNLDADFIFIDHDVGVMIDRHIYIRELLDHLGFMPHLQVAGVSMAILSTEWKLENEETRMSEKMKNLRDLREISEYE